MQIIYRYFDCGFCKTALQGSSVENVNAGDLFEVILLCFSSWKLELSCNRFIKELETKTGSTIWCGEAKIDE
jgi:hypothetical protein